MVQAGTGKAVIEVECNPTNATFSRSPNGKNAVAGPLLLHGGEANCVGGGKGDQEVDLIAVTDEGTAFGGSPVRASWLPSLARERP